MERDLCRSESREEQKHFYNHMDYGDIIILSRYDIIIHGDNHGISSFLSHQHEHGSHVELAPVAPCTSCPPRGAAWQSEQTVRTPNP